MKNDRNYLMTMVSLLWPPLEQAGEVGSQTGTTATRGLTPGPFGHMLSGFPGHVHCGAQLFTMVACLIPFASVVIWTVALGSQSMSCCTPCCSGPFVAPGFTLTVCPT